MSWKAAGWIAATVLPSILAVGAGPFGAAIATEVSREKAAVMNAHVTIYLEPPLLNEGGAVIVAARPMPDDEWRDLPGGRNPAANDLTNPKREEVRQEDRHFGAVVSSPVSFVEFAYPESGSFTFNFLPTAAYRDEFGERLQTERVLVGSSDKVPDPEGGFVDWPSVSTIAVIGPNRSQAFARVADATATAAFDDNPTVEHFEGLRTISLTPDQIERYVRG